MDLIKEEHLESVEDSSSTQEREESSLDNQDLESSNSGQRNGFVFIIWLLNIFKMLKLMMLGADSQETSTAPDTGTTELTNDINEGISLENANIKSEESAIVEPQEVDEAQEGSSSSSYRLSEPEVPDEDISSRTSALITADIQETISSEALDGPNVIVTPPQNSTVYTERELTLSVEASSSSSDDVKESTIYDTEDKQKLEKSMKEKEDSTDTEQKGAYVPSQEVHEAQGVSSNSSYRLSEADLDELPDEDQEAIGSITTSSLILFPAAVEETISSEALDPNVIVTPPQNSTVYTEREMTLGGLEAPSSSSLLAHMSASS